MRIGILDSGGVGRALDRSYSRYGHDTRLGTRKRDLTVVPRLFIGHVLAASAEAEIIELLAAGGCRDT